MNISASENSVSDSQCTPAGHVNCGIVSARWIGPVSATPRAASAPEAAMLAMITTRAPGMRGTRSSANRPASAATPQARLGSCQAPGRAQALQAA